MKVRFINFNFKFSNLFKNKNNKSVIFWLVGFFLFFLSSCATTTYLDSQVKRHDISINSYGNYNVDGKTFYIESGDENIASTDLEFREYADYVAISLDLQGAQQTSNKRDADLCILINYNISDESYIETVPIPMWGQTGVSSVTTTTQSSRENYGSVYREGNNTHRASGGNKTTSTTTEVNPTYGITGFTNIDKKITQYCRSLNIYAFDNKEIEADPLMLWKTNLLSYGESNDLRRILPYMAYAAWGEMGKSSGGETYYSILENDLLFHSWKEDILNLPTVTIFPSIDYSNVSKQFNIAMVIRNNEETLILLKKTGCISEIKRNSSIKIGLYFFGVIPGIIYDIATYRGEYYSIPETMYIETNGEKKQINSVFNYELGTKIRHECGTRYFILRFPPIDADAYSINLKDSKAKGWEWQGIKLK